MIESLIDPSDRHFELEVNRSRLTRLVKQHVPQVGGLYPSEDILHQLEYIANQTYVATSYLPEAGQGLMSAIEAPMPRGARFGRLLGLYCGGVVGTAVGGYVMTMWPGGPTVAGSTDTRRGMNKMCRINDPLGEVSKINCEVLEGGADLSNQVPSQDYGVIYELWFSV